MPFAICMVFQIRFVGLGLGILALGIGPSSDLLLLGSESWLTIRLLLPYRAPLLFPYHPLTKLKTTCEGSHLGFVGGCLPLLMTICLPFVYHVLPFVYDVLRFSGIFLLGGGR